MTEKKNLVKGGGFATRICPSALGIDEIRAFPSEFVDHLMRVSDVWLSVEDLVEEREWDLRDLICSARKHLYIDQEACLTFCLLTRVRFCPVF